MALRIVRRVFPAIVGVGLLQGCFTTGDDDSGSSSGCSKDSDCKNGRICESKVCVNDDSGAVLGGSSGTSNGQGGSSTPAKGGTGSGGKGGTSAQAGTGGSTPANGGSASGSGGTGGSSSGSGGTAGAATGPCTSVDDPATCPTTDSMTYCDGTMLVTVTCSDFCTKYGFPPLPCTAPSGCDCDVNNPTDQVCATATDAFCSCLTDGCVTTPDANDPNSLSLYPPVIYAACHAGQQADQDFFHCIYDQSMLDPVPLCSDAFAACGVDTGSAGAPAM